MGLQLSFGLVQQLLVLLLQSTLPFSDLPAQLLELIVEILVEAMMIITPQESQYLNRDRH